MSAHTPGPWRVSPDGQSVGTGVAGPMVALTWPQDWQAIVRGAGVPAFPEDAAERAANTRLIAAAPVMLEQVRASVAQLRALLAAMPPDHPLRDQLLEITNALAWVLEPPPA